MRLDTGSGEENERNMEFSRWQNAGLRRSPEHDLLFDLKTRQQLSKLQGRSNSILVLDFSRDGKS